MDNPTVIRTTQVLASALPMFVAGAFFTSSAIVMPNLYDHPPSVAAPIFSAIYWAGVKTMAPLPILSTIIPSVLAYAIPEFRTQYVASALLTFSALPFTIVFMAPTNDRLCDIAASGAKQAAVSQQIVKGLLQKWTLLNGIRCGLVLAGGLVAAWTLVQQDVEGRVATGKA